MTEVQWQLLRGHILNETEGGKKYSIIDVILAQRLDLPIDFIDDLKVRLAKDPEIGVQIGYELTFGRKNY